MALGAKSKYERYDHSTHQSQGRRKFLLSQSDFGVQNSLVEYLSTQTIEICFRTVNGLACAWDIPRYKMSARHQPRFVKEFTRDRIKNAIDQYVRSPQ